MRDTDGNSLLPVQYDSILSCHDGFLLSEGGRWGYVSFDARIRHEEEGCTVRLGMPHGNAVAWLPCLWDRIDVTRNGLSLTSYSTGNGGAETTAWYDVRERRLYRHVRWLRSFGNLDYLYDTDVGAALPYLKVAGEDRRFRFPDGADITVLEELLIESDGVRFFLCQEVRTSETAGDTFVYFFMVLYDDSFTIEGFAQTPNELYERLPTLIAHHNAQYVRESARGRCIAARKATSKKEI